MRKIPTVFKRDTDNPRYVTDEVNPGCEWVLAGEGRPTRKYDGTCVMFDGKLWWARREVKAGKREPFGWRYVEKDEATGKMVGWEPMHQSGFYQFFREAETGKERAGTYELIGPKINGNPEGVPDHELIRHGMCQIDFVPTDPDELREFVRDLPWEGIVWYHPDGGMAKLKGRDIQGGGK